LTRFCDGIIMQLNGSIEREGTRSAQGSESFHNSNMSVKDIPLPFFLAEVYMKQYNTVLKGLLKTYLEYQRKGQRLPPKVHEQLIADTGEKHHFNIFLTGALEADVSRVHGGSDPNVHHINLKNKHALCDRQCLERNGSLCSFSIIFIKHSGLDPVDFVPEKYTVAGGIRFLTCSLSTIPNSNLSIKYSSLSISEPPVLPPHSRVPKGRPRNKRMTKNHKRKKYLQDRTTRRMQHAFESGDPEPELSSQFVARNYCCSLCGGPHTMKNCRSPHDGRGNLISTAHQNICLAGGFLIIEINKLGETILPKSLEDYDMMRQCSDMSINSFNQDAINLSDSSDSSQEQDDSNEEDINDNAMDSIAESQNDNEEDNVSSRLDYVSTTIVFEPDNGSNNETETHNVQDHPLSHHVAIPSSILTRGLPAKEAFTFVPKCDCCQIYNGFKIGNPVAQLVDDVGTTKYDSLLHPEEWFDAPIINSFQLACFHAHHPNGISMFTHMGMPNMVSNDNSEYDDEDIQRVLLEQTGSEIISSPPTSMILDLSDGKDRHLGVVYSENHFGVVEFILHHHIIVIYDGLAVGNRRHWRKEINNILQKELSILGHKVDRYTYAKRNVRHDSTASSSLHQIHTWVKQNETKIPHRWIVMYSEDFNMVKYDFSQLNVRTDYDSSSDTGASIFTNLAYRPEIIQRDGGFVCGALACQAINDLLTIDDEHDCHRSYMDRSVIGIENLRNDWDKSTKLRKSVMDNHMCWLDKMNKDGELEYHSNIIT
jgi:hypothetical protein